MGIATQWPQTHLHGRILPSMIFIYQYKYAYQAVLPILALDSSPEQLDSSSTSDYELSEDSLASGSYMNGWTMFEWLKSLSS